MRVGVFGGSFDPIHVGHLRAAELAREELRLDQVLLLPVGRPPHRAAPFSPGFDRYAMAALAAATNPAFVASPIELERPGPSYTVDTLEALAEAAPATDWFLLLGADAAAELATWHRAGRVRELAQVAVIGRPGAGVAGSADRVLSSTGLDVSSRAIRECLQAGRSVRHLVSSGVADYIAKRRLYP